MIKLEPAKKILKPMKVLSYGPTFSGKTLSSLYIAVGAVTAIRNCTVEEAYKHIVLIDTEYGRGALYSQIGLYNYLRIDAPYNTEKLTDYIQDLNMLDEVDVIIVDSLTHFWTKDGGILDQKAQKDKQGGNTYTNWLDYTAKFNKMVDVLMASPKHILTTARAKSDTALEDINGKKVPKTYGLKPEVRDGLEYDFDITFNIDKESHNLIVEKGVPGMERVYEMATPEIGATLYKHFVAGATIPVRTKEIVMEAIRTTSKNHNQIQFVQLTLSGRKLDDLSLEDLLKLEKEIINNIKKQQIKK